MTFASLCPPLLDRSADTVGDGGPIFVLPGPHDAPSVALERIGDTPVALDVAEKLRRPVRAIPSRLVPVDGACVPEATVDEQRDPRASKDDVWAHDDLSRNDAIVDTEAQTFPVEEGSHPLLWPRVTARVCSHARRDVGIERYRITAVTHRRPPPNRASASRRAPTPLQDARHACREGAGSPPVRGRAPPGQGSLIAGAGCS